MSNPVTFSLCVLWEDELRAASRALCAMRAAKEEDFPELARDALNACSVALHGLTDEKTAVMCGASEVRSLMLRTASDDAAQEKDK